jgi:nitric oxide reductase activation protein
MRHYDEWDYQAQAYRPDWVSLSEHLHPSGSAAMIDQLLARHARVVKRLERMLDMLKPQSRVRIRFQEDGSDLDLDVAVRSLIDFKAGAQPDPRINMSHRTDGRSIAVSLLLDLSVSVNDKPEGCQQTTLELSQQAVSLLAWAMDRMGDPFAIGGFHSNSRHAVRYFHLKGFSEAWGDEAKARIAAMAGAYSTRMGAAMRHAGQALNKQQADKKLLLILTDGRPHDVDVKDEQYLIHDARKAVQELGRDGIYAYCINLDPKADEYVADIFASQYAVIDDVERLPERLPELFISLTK